MAIERSKSPEDFVAFELAGWGERIAGYDEALGSVSRQTVQPTLDAARVAAGMRVLDVCTGPGMLVEAALQRGAKAVGLDFSDAVVEFARAQVPKAEFQRGDAQALPFPDNSFDAVLCGYGIMHVPEPDTALREMMRVVRPGGRVALSVLDGATSSSVFSLTYAAVRAHGRSDIPLPHGPDFFQFGTPAKMRASLEEVGFADIEALPVAQFWNVDNAQKAFAAILSGTVRASALLAAQSDSAKAGIQGYFEKAFESLRRPGGGYAIPLPAIVGSGAKR